MLTCLFKTDINYTVILFCIILHMDKEKLFVHTTFEVKKNNHQCVF